MGASLSKLRDRTRLWTRETEEIGNPGRRPPEWSRYETPEPTRLVLAARGNLHHQEPSAPTSFFGNYMTFPPYNSFIQQGSLHYTSPTSYKLIDTERSSHTKLWLGSKTSVRVSSLRTNGYTACQTRVIA
ncbi:hypothetical protein Emag_007558 [Eimeria magna]